MLTRNLREAIVEFMAFSSGPSDLRNLLRGFGHWSWKNGVAWLHDAGLALYFLQKIKSTGSIDMVPEWAQSQLERDLTANKRRIAQMTRRFQSVNQSFDRAGVKYAAVKGFSLVPQFCPEADLRPIGDLDYLVAADSVPLARQVLEKSGYLLQRATATEFKFLAGPTWVPRNVHDQYSAEAPCPIELHLSLWDEDTHGMRLAEPQFSMTGVKTQEWRGLVFPALPEEDAFLRQAIHAFHHILTYWVRMSWLYEIAYALHRRADDSSFWRQVENRMGGDPVLREAVTVVMELATKFFRAPLPPIVVGWAREVRSPVRIWIQNYARIWAFGNNHSANFGLFPTAKLVLFLHQQYVHDGGKLARSRLLPLKRMPRIARSIMSKPATVLDPAWRRKERMARKVFFHVAADCRYLCEIPRWRRLNKMATQLSPA